MTSYLNLVFSCREPRSAEMTPKLEKRVDPLRYSDPASALSPNLASCPPCLASLGFVFTVSWCFFRRSGFQGIKFHFSGLRFSGRPNLAFRAVPIITPVRNSVVGRSHLFSQFGFWCKFPKIGNFKSPECAYPGVVPPLGED